MKRKRYTTSFKEMIVKELATGVRVVELARKYAIPNTLPSGAHAKLFLSGSENRKLLLIRGLRASLAIEIFYVWKETAARMELREELLPREFSRV